MAGMLGEAMGGAGMPPAGAAMPPAGGVVGQPGPAGGQQKGNPGDMAQALLIYQPLKMLYQPKQVESIITAASHGDPAKVIASAAISSVMASAKAGMESGAPIKEEMFGNAVVEVIKGLGGLLAASKAFDPNELPNIINGAIEFAAQAGGEGAQPPQGPAGAAPGPGGNEPPPGMAGGPQPMGA